MRLYIIWQESKKELSNTGPEVFEKIPLFQHLLLNLL